MSSVPPVLEKSQSLQNTSRRQKYLKIPYTYVRLFLSVLMTFCIIAGVSIYRIRQYQVSEQEKETEYTNLLNTYNDLDAQSKELTAKLNEQLYKNDSTQQTLDAQAAKLNEQNTQYSQDLDELTKETDDLQQKLDELEKAKEDIVSQLNGISYLPSVSSASLAEAAPLAVTYSSNPIQLLQYKLNALAGSVSTEADFYAELTDAVKKDVPILNDYPTTWPVKGIVTSGFGYRQNPMGGEASEFHTGLDIAVPLYTDVRATGGGVVKEAGWNNGGYGNLVVIDHGNGIETYYGHNSQVLVKVGDKVTRGQIIAKSGSTGNSTGPHVHYEVRVNGNPVNPTKYVNLS